MLRALLIYLSQAAWARKLVTGWPVAWKVSARFVAGETLDDALAAIRALNAAGMYVTLDHLGEHTHSALEARQATVAIVQALDAIAREGLKAGVSIKLSQLGLALDPELATENLAYILGHAQAYDIFVRLDMEDSPFVDATLALFRYLHEKLGVEGLGVVIQSYLYRSMVDTQQLMSEGVRVRLVKGAYKEPPEVAFPKKKDVDANFDRLTEVLVAGAVAHGCPPARADGRMPPIPAIATHDAARVAFAKQAAAQAGLPKEAIEFQMLYGIRRELQAQLVTEGYPVRVYVPYGRQWYPYVMRRLAERPANLWFFVSNLLRR